MAELAFITPRAAALHYAARGWPVFPCQWHGKLRKHPLTEHGLHDATTDIAVITAWWSRWPKALIGMPTGEPIDAAVLDVDMKNGNDGLATLAALDSPILPATPTVHTATGGLHLYVARPTAGLRNTSGKRGRGIGPGLDWRGDGGYVILPSPGSGYRWDKRWHFGTCNPVPVPAGLLPRELERPPAAKPVRPTPGLSPYAEAALDSACRKILAAPPGEQEVTLHAECFSIGTLAGAGGVPEGFARRVLIWAARQIPDHDPRRPWRAAEIERKVDRAFDGGMSHPREAQHHG
jgi:hypothetical protein